jgi:sRNA-binding carbon storage regulator CsrA
MLVLSRKIDEGVYLYRDGRQIAKLIVHQCGRSSTRIRIEADADIQILREESWATAESESVPPEVNE